MNGKGAIFKVEWRTRNGKAPYLRIENKGDVEANKVNINIDLEDETDPIDLPTILHIQPKNSIDITFPSPDGYCEDVNWQIEVTIDYDDTLGHRNEKFTVMPRLQ